MKSGHLLSEKYVKTVHCVEIFSIMHSILLTGPNPVCKCLVVTALTDLCILLISVSCGSRWDQIQDPLNTNLIY
jgi:hypothetical protein